MILAKAAADASKQFVELDVHAWQWIGLIVAILVLLAIDLYRHRHDKAPTFKSAAAESAAWVTCGLLFSVVILVGFGDKGGQAFGEYISGYLIEKSLSVDNVFVWSMLFSTLAIPLKYQHRVLFWGIFGALVLRAIFIGAGTALITSFWWLLVVFGLFLVYTGVKVFRHRDDEEERQSTPGLGLLRRFMPVTDQYDGHKFFTKVNARRAATPLFAALVVVELTDVIFAVDSVPAILAVSHEPFIVFSSNAFAILGLRAMYFLLADAKEKFHYLSHALGAILVFVGLKMTVAHWWHMNTYVSLAVIITILVAAVIGSIAYARRQEELGSSHSDTPSPSPEGG